MAAQDRKRRTMSSIHGIAIALAAGAWMLSVAAVAGQQEAPERRIWNGVFTEAQVERGKGLFVKGGCGVCHGPQLVGSGSAPALQGDPFLTYWQNKTVRDLLAFVRDRMPPNRAYATDIGNDGKVDVVAFLLSVNGYPAGPTELRLSEPSSGDAIISRKDAVFGAANFSHVKVVGCLNLAVDHTWSLLRASAAAVVKEPVGSSTAQDSVGLGTNTYQLVSVARRFSASEHVGQKVAATGLLYRTDREALLNLTGLVAVGSCAE